MTFIGVALSIVFAIIIWKYYPLLLAPVDFLVKSPAILFVGRFVASIVGGFMFAGILLSTVCGSLSKRESVKKAADEVVVFDTVNGETKTAPSDGDPQRDLFYFDTPILGFNLGMTIPQLNTLMGKNIDALKIVDYIGSFDVIGRELVEGEAVLFSDGAYKEGGAGWGGGIVSDLFAEHKNSFGMVVYRISDTTKCPVRVDNLDPIWLTFIGGRLAVIKASCGQSENIVFKALTSKYERTSWRQRSYPDTFPILRVGDKECLLCEHNGVIVNVPYIKAIIKLMILNIQKQKTKEDDAKQQAIDKI